MLFWDEASPTIIQGPIYIYERLRSHYMYWEGSQGYSVLHVRLESKSHKKLFVIVMCDVVLQCHSETLNC